MARGLKKQTPLKIYQKRNVEVGKGIEKGRSHEQIGGNGKENKAISSPKELMGKTSSERF